MSQPYRTCPSCGANLDPGELCDCLESHGIVGLPEPEDSDDVPYHDDDIAMADDDTVDGEGEDDGYGR